MEGPFWPDRGGDLPSLREALRRAGFDERALSDILEGRSDRQIDLQCALRRAAEASPFQTLLRLFILGVAVDEGAACLALLPAEVECLIDGGLIERTDGGLRATARLAPCGISASQRFLSGGGRVAAVGFRDERDEPLVDLSDPADLSEPGDDGIDVGTGAGIHALLAASHADRVVATDTNPRALNFAWMNARLNGIENVSFRQGSFFEPVRHEKFDLIVSNPPFIISPESSLMFQNPGMGGDAVSELIVRESPAHLNEGGCAVSLMSWHHENEDDWFERPCGWAAGSGWRFLAFASDQREPAR